MAERKKLNNDMYLLMGALCNAGVSSPEDFYKGESYGIELETDEIIKGAAEIMFLSYPTQRKTIDGIISNFERATGREAVVKTDYMGQDVDTDKTTILVGINGKKDITEHEKYIKDNLKKLDRRDCKIIREIAESLKEDSKKKERHI